MDLQLIANKKQTIIVISLIFLLVATIFTFLQPVKYGASSKILVVQKFEGENSPYALARARAYLSGILAEVVTTNPFYKQVAEGNFGVEKKHFEANAQTDQALANWKEAVSVTSAGRSGVIEVVVEHSKLKQAENISHGILEILTNEHNRFHNGENVNLKIIDPPTITLTSPNVRLNFSVAFLAGIVAAFAYIKTFPAPEYDLNIFKRRRRKKSRNGDMLEIQTLKTLDK